ncbi:hypothetical protein N7451_012312 [Penicillium sp. IBT 35674x]|nr:hypothetical protein N7451_012312 [Penicillium sp. IBT 35674x]
MTYNSYVDQAFLAVCHIFPREFLHGPQQGMDLFASVEQWQQRRTTHVPTGVIVAPPRNENEPDWAKTLITIGSVFAIAMIDVQGTRILGTNGIQSRSGSLSSGEE